MSNHMVKVTSAQKLKDITGADTDMTFGQFLSEVCWAARESQGHAYTLATKFVTQAEVELKAEDVILIKSVMSKIGARAGEAGQILAVVEPTKE